MTGTASIRSVTADIVFNEVAPGAGFGEPPAGPGPLVFHRSLPGYRPTPLIESPPPARRLAVGRVLIKQEGGRLGLPAHIITAAPTDPSRVEAIRRQGARVTEWPGSYDQAVDHVAGPAAADPGTLLISDTSWPGYETVPGWATSTPRCSTNSTRSSTNSTRGSPSERPARTWCRCR